MPRKSRSDKEPTYFERWPINRGAKRKLYVAAISEQDRATLEARNYEVLDVLSLPRDTDERDQEAIEAWLQGMSEGSIALDEERRKALMDEAKVKGYLVTKSVREVKHTADATLEEMLNFGGSRHTLNRADVAKLEKATKAAVTPGEKVKH